LEGIYNPSIEDDDYGETSQRINEAVDFVSSDWLLPPSESDGDASSNSNNTHPVNTKKRTKFLVFDSLIE
jgi:hypothetical protein